MILLILKDGFYCNEFFNSVVGLNCFVKQDTKVQPELCRNEVKFRNATQLKLGAVYKNRIVIYISTR
jgi:hypothetical protein